MYASTGDLELRFGEAELVALTDRSDSGMYDDDFIGAAIADASAEIDSYIGARYALPLPGTPPLLRRLCCDIARYRLYDDSPTEAVSTLYQQAVRQLQAIAAGATQLTCPGAGPAQAQGGIVAARKPLAFDDGTFGSAYDRQLLG